MNIAVMGHMGMLGRAVQQEVMRQGHVLRIFYEDSWEIKARRIQSDKLPDEDIDVVINCAGAVPQKEDDPKAMVFANAYAPYLLKAACDAKQVRLVHVSTDCVFSAPGPHTEASPVSPKSLYGLSKATGEITSDPHLTVRTSFIGLGSFGLLHDLMNDEHVEASQRLLWSGHTVSTVAHYLVLLVEMKEVTGLLHMPGEWTNRWLLCNTLKDYFDLPVNIIQKDEFFADRRLLSTRWNKLGLPEIPSFEKQLKEYVR